MPHQTEAIVKHLREIARQIESVNPNESAAIQVVADQLQELFAQESDPLGWLEREQRFELAADKAAALLESVGRQDIAEGMRELVPVLRGVRAARLREIVAALPDQLIAESATVLRRSLADRHKTW